MARIYRDDWGIPHVRARSVLDLAHGQGQVTARDRAWQLEFQRRRAIGTTAEVLGPSALPWDRFARRTRITDTARRAHARLSAESRAFVAAYVDGVNAGLRGDAVELQTLGIEPEPWEEWTPLAVFHAQHILFASMPGKLWTARAREVLGDDARLLSHEGPVTSGSNAWAVGGARTATGLPLVAGDPHRTIESPGVYQQVRLACEEFDVVGFAFPGVPGIQHFGHAGEVAWAITNASSDYQDVYAERLRRDGTGAGAEALGPEGWEPATVERETVHVLGREPDELEVVTTARGPLFSGCVDEGGGLSLRGPSAVLGDLGFDALLPLLRARSVDDVGAALDAWVEPVNNVVVADRAGAVRYRVAGRVPLREEPNRLGVVDAADPATVWTGWVDPLPRTDVPPDGAVVTANERRGPESTSIGTTFAPPHRARRLHDLLSGRTGLTPADLAACHGDTLVPALDPVLALLDSTDPGPAGREVRQAIRDWDRRMDADSAGAAAFAAWRNAFATRLAREPVFEPLATPLVDDPVLAPWLDPAVRIGLALEGLVDAAAPCGIDLVPHAGAALDDAAGHAASWGETHQLTTVHAFDLFGDALSPPVLPEVGLSGDIDSVRVTGSQPGVADECWRGSVARYVWDLADRQHSGWVVPLGASGDPRDSHHHDQLETWADARLVPVITDWSRLMEESP